jgi:hypothetical protein
VEAKKYDDLDDEIASKFDPKVIAAYKSIG